MRAAALVSIAGLIATTGIAAAQDLVAEGENVFRRCAACHAIGEGATHRVGPQLNNVIGRQAGSLEDYNYSQAMKTAGEEGLVWDEETLDEFLTNPAAMIPGTKMVFPGLRQEEQRQAVIAYLASHSEAEAGQGQGGSQGSAGGSQGGVEGAGAGGY
ncbi:MAG TPA: cytochrome c family protein [Afifellaceae bacterium]|nr:cytochrome c family protein [Afifellaceae bacterium]